MIQEQLEIENSIAHQTGTEYGFVPSAVCWLMFFGS